jgi:hypothetical protein
VKTYASDSALSGFRCDVEQALAGMSLEGVAPAHEQAPLESLAFEVALSQSRVDVVQLPIEMSPQNSAPVPKFSSL